MTAEPGERKADGHSAETDVYRDLLDFALAIVYYQMNESQDFTGGCAIKSLDGYL